MKALLIGGTGVISGAVTECLCRQGWEVTLLNRGSRAPYPGARQLRGDMEDEAGVRALLAGETFDAVCDFIVYTPEQAARDARLFAGKTGQYVLISTVAAYCKPLPRLPITEDTPLENPYWRYAQQKAACEAFLMEQYRQNGFPATIVRPGHTYSERSLPTQIHGANGAWAVVDRIRRGKSVPLAGDGETLWTVTTAADFATYFCALLGKPQAIGEAFHITSGETVSWNAIYRALAEASGGRFVPCYLPAGLLALRTEYDLRGSLLGDKAVSVRYDNGKVQRVSGLGERPFTPMTEGVGRSVAFFLAHPELQRPDPAFDAFCERMAAIQRETEAAFKA